MAGQAMLEEIVRTIIIWIEDIEEHERTPMEQNILDLCKRHVPDVTSAADDWLRRPWTEEHHWFGGRPNPPDWGGRIENGLYNVRWRRDWLRCYRKYPEIQTWEHFCGLSGTHRDLTANNIINLWNWGKVSTSKVLAALRAEGVEPSWAAQIERHFKLAPVTPSLLDLLLPKESITRRLLPPRPAPRPTDWNDWAEYVETHECFIHGHKGARQLINQWADINGWAPVTNKESFEIGRVMSQRKLAEKEE